MTSLNKPTLGTDPVKGWQYYSLHLAGSYVLKEFFLASYYRGAIGEAEGHAGRFESALPFAEQLKGTLPNRDLVIANARDLSRWAKEMREQGFHEMHTHAFIGMWAAFEAGMEDTVAAVIQHDRLAAEEMAAKFKKDRYQIQQWPWPRDVCVEMAKKLDGKAKDATANGGPDLFARLATLYSWLGISIAADESVTNILAEASTVRNLILHRYGEVSESDASNFPSLRQWVGKVVPMTNDRFTSYNNAIQGTIISVMAGMRNSRHAPPQAA